VGTRISTVVKVLCQIDIAQRKSIQEGSFAAKMPDDKHPGKFRRVDYRVSFAPAVLGQNSLSESSTPAAPPLASAI